MKKTQLKLIACLNIFLMTCTVSLATTPLNIVASADTQIVESQPVTVFGKHHSLTVTNFSPYKARSLYRFDLSAIPDNQYILSATLRLRLGAWGWNVPLKVTGHKLLVPWNETTTTWNTFGHSPGSGGVAGSDYQAVPIFGHTITANQGANNSGMFVEFDVTDMVREWHENPSTNFGIYLTDALLDSGENPDSIKFFLSRESWMGTDTAPRLSVTHDDRNLDVRVMCYNVRQSGVPDGENAWVHRQGIFLESIQTFDPDLLGTQEVLHEQAEFLRHHFPDYGFHGVGRNDGQTSGEYSAVLYRLSRFEKIDGGHIWLSEQPDVPGSIGWDASHVRIFSWVILRDRQTNRPVFFASTHWDHRGTEARRQSAILIRDFIETFTDTALIVVGDFNLTEDSEPYLIMTEGLTEDARELIDSYRAVYPERSEHEATYHGFTGRTLGSRIDWILHSDEFEALEAEIVRTSYDGRYPSDHYPVTTIISWQE